MLVKGPLSQATKQLTFDKFTHWDTIVSENWFEDPAKQDSAYSVLSDPTYYSYAFFRDKRNRPVSLYPYQDMILNDTHRFILFVASNQIGKSFSLCVKSVTFALHNPGKTVLMISRTFPQSKDLLRQIRSLLQSSNLDYKFLVGDSENKTEIYFKHFDDDGKELPQSRIICVPATEAALGYAADLLLLDELAFYDNGREFYYQIALPRTYETKGQVIVFSNPNGQQGILWEMYNDPSFHVYQFNFLEKPENTIEEYEDLRKKLPREKFDSTVNAEFTSPMGGFLTYAERKSIQFERDNFLPSVLTQPVSIFFDFAKSKDRTVRIIGQLTGPADRQEVFVHEMKEYPHGTPYDEIIEDLGNLIKQIGADKIGIVGWDNTGVGRGIEDFINKIVLLGVNCTPVEFSLENKSAMYSMFKLLVEQKRINIPYVEECDNQLSKLVFKTSSRGYLMIHHAQESDRDDYPDSIAGLCNLLIGPDTVPVTMEII